MGNLTINTRKVGDVLVFSLQGDLDAFTVRQMRKSLNQFIEEGNHRIVVDCSEVGYINSTTIGILVGKMHKLRALDGELILAALNERVNRVITLVGGRRLFLICDTVHEAIVNLTQKQTEDLNETSKKLPDSGILVLNSR